MLILDTNKGKTNKNNKRNYAFVRLKITRSNAGRFAGPGRIDLFTVFSTFDMDKLRKIRRRYWKERLKISKTVRDLLKLTKI